MSSSPYSRTEQLRAVWPWLPLWTVVALLAIFSHGPMPLYSTRTLALAWEMWNQGHWLVPHINGQPYSEKAPLLFWLMNLGWAVLGVNETWGRLVAPLFALGSLLLSARLARHLFPKYPAVVGAAPLALVGAFLFTVFASITYFDTMVTFFTLLGLLGIWRAAEGKNGPDKLIVALMASLVLLVAVFSLLLSFVNGAPGGTKIPLSAVDPLARGHRVVSATLLNEDSQLVLKLRSVTDATELAMN